MLNEKICKLREELNESIVNGNDYSVTYKLSIQLDDLIAEYYQKNMLISKKGNKYLVTK